MYKKIFLPALFILICHLSFGQIELGIKLGPNASRSIFDNETYNTFNKSKFKAGFQGGLVVVFENPKNDKYALLTEFYYYSIGRKVDSRGNTFTLNTAKYHYLHLPIMFRMRFKFDSFDWYVILGPQVSYWLGGKGTYDVLDGSRNVINSYQYKINFGEPVIDFGYMNMADVNRFQLGLSLGLGWYYEINDADRVAAGLRYYFGHSYMGKPKGGEIPHTALFDNFESVNHSIELSLFYTFDIYQKVRIIKKSRYK